MKVNFWWLIAIAFIFTVYGIERAFAEPLVWQTPIGQIGLPFQSTEIIPIGYDIKYNQGISGASLPIWISPKNYIDLQIGAVGAWPTQAANAQPYVAFGHDFARDIPLLAEYKSVHINGFGRWVSDKGDKFPIGYGVSASYSLGTSPESAIASARFLMPLTSELSLIPRTQMVMYF